MPGRRRSKGLPGRVFRASRLDLLVLRDTVTFAEPRPGGVLGLVWNSRDTRAEWLRDAGEIMHERHDASATFESYVKIGAPFGPVEEHTARRRERRVGDHVTARGGRVTGRL